MATLVLSGTSPSEISTSKRKEKKVRNNIIKKIIHVRIEHVKPSRCAKEATLRRKNIENTRSWIYLKMLRI